MRPDFELTANQMFPGDIAVKREYERVLCPACQERFTVEGTDYCRDCIQIAEDLDGRFIGRRHVIQSVPRFNAGLDAECREQTENPVSEKAAWSMILGGVVLFALAGDGMWHLSHWVIRGLLELSK